MLEFRAARAAGRVGGATAALVIKRVSGVGLERRIRVATFILAVALMSASEPAWAEIPSDIQARIRAVAEDYRARGLQRARAASSANPVLVRVMAENGRRISESRMAAVAIAAITNRPALADEVLREVSAVVPELAGGVRERVSRAFPFRATGPAPPPPAVATRPRPGKAAPPADAAESDEDEEAAAAAELAAGDIAPEPDDPLEGFNRGVFWVNDMLDRWIFRPIAWTYGKLMPEPGKRGLRNVVRNLKGPIILINDLLQLEFADASVTTARFVANTTLGLGGLFDVATALDLKHHSADFGQTLHAYGVRSGPYIVLPLIGPSTARDGVGYIVDTFFDPLIYVLEPSENLIKAGAKLLIERERILKQSDELRKSSLDYYAAVRSLYLQDRAVELRRGDADASARTEPWVPPDQRWLDQDA